VRALRCALFVLVAAGLASSACSGAFARKYEYEEEVYLRVDGGATVYVNASVPALVALRGANLPIDPAARLDRNHVRDFYQSPVTEVENVSLSRRDNRRYVHLRIDVPDVRALASAAPFAWSSYRFDVEAQDGVAYEQTVGAAAAAEVGNVGWTGGELVAFRLHVPSRISFHNAPSKTVERGNIVIWEQPLEARLRGEPVDIRVVMARESILASTLTLFGAMIVLAALTFGAVIWLVMRRGQKPTGSRFPQ
jgi:hypothetical protein